ncbi:MAG: hypothetical protein J3R72DRAFT_526171 [Linnemannia gamsii]|nr:MAG: hypothetical protein J3R72DRAFT_526171 [Linnemannia gamsii]
MSFSIFVRRTTLYFNRLHIRAHIVVICVSTMFASYSPFDNISQKELRIRWSSGKIGSHARPPPASMGPNNQRTLAFRVRKCHCAGLNHTHRTSGVLGFAPTMSSSGSLQDGLAGLSLWQRPTPLPKHGHSSPSRYLKGDSQGNSQGNADSQTSVGKIYQNGRGLNKDLTATMD